MTDFRPGDIVAIPNSKTPGVVRYAGTTAFADGVWVGIELESPDGKNDGSVRGQRYFACRPMHGMFVKPHTVTLIERTSAGANGKTSVNGAPKKPRTSTVAPTDATKRRQTVAPSPSTGSRLSMRSPTKSPTKALPASTPSTRPAPRTSVAPGTRPTSGIVARTRASVSGVRQSMGPPSAQVDVAQPPLRRTSMAPSKAIASSARTSSTPRSSGGRSSQEVTDLSGATSNNSDDEILSPSPIEAAGLHAEEHETSRVQSPKAHSKIQNTPNTRPTRADAVKPSSNTISPRPKAPASSLSATSSAAAKKIEQLEAQVRIMERKRMEDREKLKSLPQLQEEKRRLEDILQKLQKKYQPQQQELDELRKQLANVESLVDGVERMEAEKDSEIEMANLDREMAEEMAESFKSELEALRAKTQDLELEIEVLREENDLFNEETPAADRSSQSWIHMEKEKTRLKEALIRLRELSQDKEEELKDQIGELEADLKDFEAVRNQYEAVQERLRKSEETIGELREQLDAADAQEEVIENLTETNARLQTEMGDLRGLIQDLEDIQAVNDELEADHQATQKELQAELDYRESLIMDHRREFATQMRHIEELEFMVGKYKDTMAAVQKDFDDMRETRQITETEAADFNERSRTVMDLQLKLQTSESKAQMKKIDMELQKLKAEETQQHLTILQNFIVESFEKDRKPVEALLRFRRIAFKALIMKSVLRDQGGTKENRDSTNDLLRFEIQEKLEWINATSTRFITFGSHCTVQEFSTLGQAYYEVEALERALNVWIESLRTNELDVRYCATELNKFKAIMLDLGEKLIPSTLATEADALHCQTLMVESYLETVVTVLPVVKDIVLAVASVEDDVEANAQSSSFTRKLQDLEFQTRSTKVVAGKVAKALEEMIQRSDSFNGASSEMFEPAETLAQELSLAVRRIMGAVQTVALDDSREINISHSELHTIMTDAVRGILKSSHHQTDVFTAMTAVIEDLHTRLLELNNAATDITRATEFERGPSPWTTRAKELKARRELSAETEETLRRLQSDIQSKSEILAAKDRQLEEQHIRIELLESRTKEVKSQAAIVRNLESELEKARNATHKAQKEYSDMAIEHERLQGERDADRSQLETLRRAQLADGGDSVLPMVDKSAALAMEQQLSAVKLEIDSLQAAVRYLKEENHRLQLPLGQFDLTMSNHAWLTSPLPTSRRSKSALSTTNPDSPSTTASSIAQESKELFNQLLEAADHFPPVDLRKSMPITSLPQHPKETQQLPQDQSQNPLPQKSTWRPIKSTPRYQVLKQREELERWDELVRDLVSKQKYGFSIKKRRWYNAREGEGDYTLSSDAADTATGLKKEFNGVLEIVSH